MKQEILRFKDLKSAPRITCNLYNGMLDELKIEYYNDGGKMVANYDLFEKTESGELMIPKNASYDVIITVSTTAKERIK